MEQECPRCGKTTKWENNPDRPFCSKVCKERDLGNWVLERYRIPSEEGESSADHDDEEES